MILKKRDSLKKLYTRINAGLISQRQLQKLIEAQYLIMFHSHLEWTFDEFTSLCHPKNDIQLIDTLLIIDKRINKRRFKRKLNVQVFLQLLRFVKFAIEDIIGAMKNIKQPPMSDDKKQAGFDRLNFGEQGIARTVGEFEHMSTTDAFDLPMFFIIRSLSDMARIKMCEKRHTDIMKTKSKSK